jgi:hypothetical protein
MAEHPLRAAAQAGQDRKDFFMETLTILVVLLVLLIFAGLIVFSITNTRQQKRARAQMAQTLGITPVEADTTLLAQISALYQTPGNKPRHSLHNVMRRRLPDGDLFLFDLVDRDGESDSWLERQAVAIRSDTLRLPPFQIFPKINPEKYALGALANAIVEWGVSKVGTPVQFPEFPAFQARYTLTSTDPEAAQRFFDEARARFFARTEYYNLRAAGGLFVFAEIQPGVKLNDPAQITNRINRALDIYRLFQESGGI